MSAHTVTVRVLRAHNYDGIPYTPGQSYECALQFVEPLVLSGNVERVEPARDALPPAPMSSARPRKTKAPIA